MGGYLVGGHFREGTHEAIEVYVVVGRAVALLGEILAETLYDLSPVLRSLLGVELLLCSAALTHGALAMSARGSKSGTPRPATSVERAGGRRERGAGKEE